MVQFVTLPRTRSVGQAIAEGLGEGISEGVSMGLQERLEQRREERKEEKVKTNILNYAQAKADKLGIGKNKAAVGFIYQTGLISPQHMVDWDPSPEELEHLQADLKEHYNDSLKPETEQDGKPIIPGNIDLTNRPRVRNADGSISTVRSKSYGINGKEVLLPTVSEDGRIMSDQETLGQYKRTGRHLGIFNSPEEATKYAKQLHEDQAKLIQQDSRQQAQYPMDQRYNLQSSRRGLPSAPGTMNINPLAVPPSKITAQEPGTIKGPAEAPPFPKPVAPTSIEDRFRTVRIKGKDIQVVKSPKDVRTVDEARTYADVVLPESKRKDFMTSARADINSKTQGIIAQEKVNKGAREQEAHEHTMNKDSKEYIDTITDQWQKNFTNMAELKSLEELSNKGDVGTFKNRILTMAGWDPSLFTNPTEDIIQKVSNDLLPGGLSAYSGMGRVMQAEIGAMIKTLPSLIQTPEGRITIIKLLHAKGMILNSEYDAMNQLRLQYQGKIRPDDFRLRVLEKAKPLMEAYQEKMHQILAPGSPTLKSMEGKVAMFNTRGERMLVPIENMQKALDNKWTIE
jgi:hypothetical protein